MRSVVGNSTNLACAVDDVLWFALVHPVPQMWFVSQVHLTAIYRQHVLKPSSAQAPYRSRAHEPGVASDEDFGISGNHFFPFGFTVPSLIEMGLPVPFSRGKPTTLNSGLSGS